MTRKCVSCGATKELKGIMKDDDDGWKHRSICKSCYFETCACEMDGHDVTDCLESPWCENHKLTVALYHNWNNYDYHFKLKKGVVVSA